MENKEPSINDFPKIKAWIESKCTTEEDVRNLCEKTNRWANDLMTRQKATRYLPNKMVKINNQIGFMTFDWSEDEIQDGLIAFFEDNLRNEQITNKG